MRTVYLGTSPFAVAVLERLAESDHRPVLVVTRPDKPRGRGRKVSPPPAAEAARALGIEVFQPHSVNSEEARERIASFDPEVVCIAAFGALIKEPLLSEYPMYNVHPSLLPRWRGAAPIERAIEAGDRETGVSIMRPTAEMDAGPVCLQAGEPILDDDDFATLSARLERLGGDLLVEALDTPPTFRLQPEEGVTIANKIGPEDRRLDPDGSPDALERRVRALNPHVGTYVELSGGERLGVRRAAVGNPDGAPAPGELAARDGSLVFGAGGGALELLTVQPEGGRPMDAAAYLRGRGASLAR
jgi:methionyl-tRNA formyltransferase